MAVFIKVIQYVFFMVLTQTRTTNFKQNIREYKVINKKNRFSAKMILYLHDSHQTNEDMNI